MVTKILAMILPVLLLLATWSHTSFALITYTVDLDNANTAPDFNNMNDLITAINNGIDTEYLVTFTDNVETEYELSPAQQTIREGVNLHFYHANPLRLVSISGRLNLSAGGGFFSAENLFFMNTNFGDDGWTITYHSGNAEYINCGFGDSAPFGDNGVAMRGSTTTVKFTNCLFRNIKTAAVDITSGSNTFTNCVWESNGIGIRAQFENGVTPAQILINGGSATSNIRDKRFVDFVSGNLVINNFTTTKFDKVVGRDFESASQISYASNVPVTFTANNCSFLDTNSSSDGAAINALCNADIPFLFTINDCYIDGNGRAGDIDSRGYMGLQKTIYNRCILRSQYGGNSVLRVYRGGTIIANNCLIDCKKATNMHLSVESGDSVQDGTMEINHCVLINNAQYEESSPQVLVTDDTTAGKQYISITNSIIDSSNFGGMNATATDLRTIIYDHNLVNVVGSFVGTNNLTGDPDFIDPASLNYHIGCDSVCINKGIQTDLSEDYDKEARPSGGSVPDIGLDEINELVNCSSTQVFDWSLY